MNEAIIGLVSAVSVVIIKGILDYFMDRRKRKDKLEDDKTDKENEILEAIKSTNRKLEDLKAEIADVREEVKEVREEAEEGRIIEARIRILHFADDISHCKSHSKDHYDQIMDDCTKYEQYSKTHEDFPNGRTKASIQLINESFNRRLKDNDFL